ncbi:zinc finger protein 652-like [Eurosta solidaginis]|uniref:zinc finger protein 652-like n=1 Tax=Eurosta solidaginis TaxID=178769 RepID=UPI0035306EEA
MSMMNPSAGTQQVSINTTAPSSYNVVCNKCFSSPKFAHFDDFLDHSHAEHGVTVRRSALSIVPENALSSERGSISHLSAQSGTSTNFSGSSVSSNIFTKNDHEFDLRTLKRGCMLDVIKLLNKCFCIWHRPTRESMPRSERLYAYQLVLMKLREHIPVVTFRDAHSIVRQIIRTYLRRQRLAAGDGVSRKSHDESNDYRQLDVIKSKMVLDRLSFLQGCDDKDVEELVPDKHCDFCNIGFQHTETLWTHMVSAHIPTARKLQFNGSIDADEPQPTESTLDSISLNRKRMRKHLSRSTFENETDVTQQSCASSEPSCLRRSRRRRRDTWRNRIHGRAKSKVVRLNKIRRRRRSKSKSGGDDTSVKTTKTSSMYLADYSDKFLEDFIDLYRQQECLWQHNSPMYRKRKLKEAAYDILLKSYCQWRKVPSVSLSKIKSLIRRIRNYYERLKHPNSNPYRSHIWQRISFIDQFPSTPSSRRSRSRDTNGTIITEYFCNVCPRIFKRRKSCESHVLKAHPPTACPRCNESFNNADELIRHILFIHRKDTECPLCQEGQEEWKSPTHMSRHFYKQRCPTCTETFHDQTNFRRHRFKCRNINRFNCNHCSLKFTSTMDFRRHAKATHKDEHPFKCDDCEISFKYLAPLAKHRRLHSRLQRTYPS